MNNIRSKLTSVRGKTLLGFAIIIILVLGMIVAGFYQLIQVQAASKAIVPGTEQIEYVQAFASATSSLEVNLDRLFVTGDAESEENIRKELSFMSDMLTTLQVQPTEGTAETIAQLAIASERLDNAMVAFLDADWASWFPNDLNRTLVDLYAHIDAVNALQQQLLSETLANLRGTAEVQQSIVDNVNSQFLILGIAVFLIAIIATIVLTRTLRPISTLTEVSLDIAGGNLNREAPVESRDEIGMLAQAFNSMTQQLRDQVDNLEQRVTARTEDLNLASNIGRQITQVRDIADVLNEATTSIKDQFDLYQVQIYLTDNRKENLTLRASDGFVGSRLLEMGHMLPIDEHSLNGSAAYNKKAVIVADTQENKSFRPHPLLPDTRSEMVVPIMLEDDVLGVMDLQSKEAGTLTEDVLPAFTLLAGQMAIAILNARQNSAMQENQIFLRTILDATPDWIFVKDRQHRYQHVNQAYADFFSLPTDMFIGKDDIELGFPEELVKGNPAKGIRGFWFDDQEVMDSGKSRELPEETITANGNNEIFQTTKSPLMDPNGTVTGFIGFAHNITKRKESEETIARRADELQTVAELSTAVAATSDPQKLLQQIVNQAKERFGLYHAHIYLMDEANEHLMLTAGAGEAGRVMVEKGISIPLNQEQSLVARAARTKEGIIVNDVMADEGFLPNLLLPETRSEMAVPMIVGTQVLGILDVQSDITNRFTSEDIQIQMTLAAQTAVALQNARQFEHTQQALADTRMFRQLIDASDQGISISSLTGKPLYVNNSYANILHIENFDDIFSANTLGDLYPEEVQARFQKEMVPAMMETGSWQDEIWHGDPNKPTITYQNHFLLKDENDRPTHTAAVITDITKQKKTEALIQENQNLMRSVMDVAPNQIVVKSKDNRFVLVNQAFSDHIGIPVEDIIGKNDIEIGFNEEDVRGNPEKGILGFWPEDQLVMESGELLTKVEAVEANGQVRHNSLLKTPFRDADGNIIGLVVFIFDITEQKESEKEQRELAQAFEEQLNQVNALQRAMTREGWEAYLSNQQNAATGFAFTGESIEIFDEDSMKALTGGLSVDPHDPAAISYDESQTAVMLPLQIHGESIGIIGARSATNQPITPDQHALLTTLTTQVAETLDRARLYEETETARSQTESLFSGSQRVVRATNMDDILSAIVETTRLQDYDRANMLFFDQLLTINEQPKSASIASIWRQDGKPIETPIGTVFTANQIPVFNLLERDNPLFIDDVATDERFDDATKTVLIEQLKMRSVVVIPLVIGNSWLGFILGIANEPQQLNDADVKQILSLAGQAATVAQSQRLYEEAATRAEREQILRQVSDRVYAAPDAETVLRTAAREIGQALGLETFIYLEDEIAEEDNIPTPEV